jgi:CBS domain-containing protein
MLRLRDIMTTDVLSVTPETSIREAMELFGRHHLSGAPVLSGGKLQGVVSGTDLMTFASALPGVPTEREMVDESDVYGEESVERDVEDERESASAYFSEMWDDAGADVTERAASVDSPEWNFLEEHDVSEVMTRSPLATLPPDAEVEAAAELMKAKKVHRVLIIDGDALVGIVTAMDITKAAADHRLTRQTFAFNRDDSFRDRA